MAALAAVLPLGLWMALHPIDRATDVTPPATSVAATAAASAPTPSPGLLLPPASDVPLLLNRIRRSAQAHGLGWPRAEYRQTAATDQMPASVEVQCTFKGTYPQIRALLADVLLDSPSTAVRSLSMTRPASEVAEVEAKLVLVTYLREARP